MHTIKTGFYLKKLHKWKKKREIGHLVCIANILPCF